MGQNHPIPIRLEALSPTHSQHCLILLKSATPRTDRQETKRAIDGHNLASLPASQYLLLAMMTMPMLKRAEINEAAEKKKCKRSRRRTSYPSFPHPTSLLPRHRLLNDLPLLRRIRRRLQCGPRGVAWYHRFGNYSHKKKESNHISKDDIQTSTYQKHSYTPLPEPSSPYSRCSRPSTRPSRRGSTRPDNELVRKPE